MIKRLTTGLCALVALAAIAASTAVLADAAHSSSAKQARHAKRHAGKVHEHKRRAGSETSGNDGPGGHADEPGSPNADHQFQGQE